MEDNTAKKMNDLNNNTSEICLTSTVIKGPTDINLPLYYVFIKRMIDIIAGIVGGIILIPIIICIKIAFLCTGDKGKVIYTQPRIGKNGKEFTIYKFRSMIEGADEVLAEYLATHPNAKAEYEKNKKLADDPRVTKVGAFIRQTSIDELPQLLNVLKGDMSLIGNRPYLTTEKKEMGMYYDDIVKTKPGISGFWQTEGRSNLSFAERLVLEQKYSKNASLWLDAKLLIKTFLIVVKQDGAI